jgi:WD40 repeat protein
MKQINEENTYGATCLIKLNEQVIAMGSWDPWETIKLFNIRTGYCVNKFKGHLNHVNCLTLLKGIHFLNAVNTSNVTIVEKYVADTVTPDISELTSFIRQKIKLSLSIR